MSTSMMMINDSYWACLRLLLWEDSELCFVRGLCPLPCHQNTHEDEDEDEDDAEDGKNIIMTTPLIKHWWRWSSWQWWRVLLSVSLDTEHLILFMLTSYTINLFWPHSPHLKNSTDFSGLDHNRRYLQQTQLLENLCRVNYRSFTETHCLSGYLLLTLQESESFSWDQKCICHPNPICGCFHPSCPQKSELPNDKDCNDSYAKH